MKSKFYWIFGLAILAFFFVQCAGSRPQLSLLKIDPPTVKAGEKELVEVKVLDPGHKVHRLILHVLDYPGYDFPLNDAGRYGDKKADDGIWTVLVPVPWDAPAQDYSVAIVAYDKNNRKILVKTEKHKKVPLQIEEVISVE